MSINKLTIEGIKKRLATNAKKHDKKMNSDIAKANKAKPDAYGYKYVPEYRKYNPGIPFRPRLELFKTSNNYFDPIKFQAYSYDWWRYLEIRKGKVVFNNYCYSMQTSGHQQSTRRLLKELGIKIDIELPLPRGLQSLETDALPYLYGLIIDIEVEMSNKRAKKDLNKYRAKKIKDLMKDVKNARVLGAKLSPSVIKEMRSKAFTAEASRIDLLEAEALQRREIRKLAKTSQGLEISQFASK